ncbi:MAG: DUF1028 domain-containing protein [Anaerolineaceae bacterium]|nr:DUF1028 domain-containing protein [Anaerolineaceae bacterium]
MTFSIVARDEKSGQLGVAVQTHWFAVGAICPWVEAGIGAVATQSMVEIGYGPKSLDLLRAGKTAQEALEALIGEDKNQALRQVAVVDALGRIAIHTGDRCIQAAGHRAGKGFSVQANMMKNNSVWPAMEKAYLEAKGDLSSRMLAALFAAQAAGGDIRGRQSAAMLVAEGEKSDEPWRQVLVNLRIDDHPEPLKELGRLLKINKAFDLMNEGDALLAKDLSEAAKEKYSLAVAMAPEMEELPFWQAVTLADTGKLEEALPIFKMVFQKNKDWAELVRRLPSSGLLKKDAVMMKRILAVLGK